MSETKSFQNSIILMPNERVTGWPTPYPTPWPTPAPCATVAYVVEASEVPLSPEVLKNWFIQSIIPLVGEEAACALEDRIDVRDGTWDAFLNNAISFRKSLVK